MIMLDLIQPTAWVGGWCGRDKWACTKCQRARVRNARWAVYKYQMLVVQIPNAVNANAY